MRLLKLTVVCLLLVLTLVSFQANVSANGNENMTDANYDPVFDEVIDAEDREKAAERTGISYRDGNVHVVVEMSTDEEVEVPSGYGIDVVQESESENRTLVEAWTDADDIRDLAAEEKVERVRQPVSPVPATSDPAPEETNGTDANGEVEGDGEEPDQDNGDDENDDSNQPLSGFTYVVALLALLLMASGRRVLR